MFVSVCVFVLLMATMLLCGSCRLRSVSVYLCVCYLRGDYAFLRVMLSAKCLVFLFMATMLLYGSCQLSRAVHLQIFYHRLIDHK